MNLHPEKTLCRVKPVVTQIGSVLNPRFWLLSMLAVVANSSAFACATCYGASDSPLAQGMNWGIATLLGVIGAVLAGVVAFFVHVGLRSTKGNAGAPIHTAPGGTTGAQPTADFTRQTDKNP